MQHKIVLSGKARVGKDTAADWLVSQGWRKVAISDLLYDICGGIQAKLGQPVVKDPRLLIGVGMLARELYGPDIWVSRLISRIGEIQGNIVVTDARFPNEIMALESVGFIPVRICRDNRIIDRDPLHISETALDDYHFENVIHNNGTIEEYIGIFSNIISQLTT